MSLATSLSLLALIAQIAHPPVAPSQLFAEFRQIKVDGVPPSAVVMVSSGASISTLSFHEKRENGRVVWLVRRMGYPESGQAQIASSDICPQLYGQLLSLERLPVSQMQIRGAQSSAPDGFVPEPPNLGPLHTSYLLWSRGWTSGQEPVEMTFSHLGSGPLAGWFSDAEAELQPCWRQG